MQRLYDEFLRHECELQVHLWMIIISIILCHPMRFASCSDVQSCYFFLHLSQVSLFPATEKETPTNNSHRCLDQSVCHKTSQQPSINLQEEGNRTLTNLLMNQNFWQTRRNIGHWSITFIYFCTTADEISTATCGAV